ncbi:Arsb [Symbiodinium natans]|uniref:Arsb protein n=1 Tax=Symbiodinium natans TaxID=878477 RepID=A0A812REI0_9DINO|nr:Arsb [Symbiodinium natans]
MGSRHVATNTREDNVSGFAGIPANMTGMAEKMKHGGYRTHLVGKWDVGMALPTPRWGRAVTRGYFQHANDYWQESMPLASTGDVDRCPALGGFISKDLDSGQHLAMRR